MSQKRERKGAGKEKRREKRRRKIFNFVTSEKK